MEYLGAWGTLIQKKKLRSKISCQTPFKYRDEQQRSRHQNWRPEEKHGDTKAG